MKILVFGHSGQVATELRALDGDDVQITALSRTEADLTDPAACAAAISAHAPDAVINAAAYTVARDIPFVSISTDYVFSGAGDTRWAPADPTDPQSVYGRTKRDGEVAIVKAGGRYAVLRTSWVVSAHGNNFVKTMLRLGAEREALTIVADQVGGPTGAAEIARACIPIAKTLVSEPKKSGIYHFSGAPDTSWADFARAIFDAAKIPCAVTDIPSSDYPTPAKRPLNSRLDCTATEAAFGISRPNWRVSLTNILTQLDFPKD
jgi:dTDP-4-dehydrorhamnose reductase